MNNAETVFPVLDYEKSTHLTANLDKIAANQSKPGEWKRLMQ